MYEGIRLTDKQLRKAGDCSPYRVPVSGAPGQVNGDVQGRGRPSELGTGSPGHGSVGLATDTLALAAAAAADPEAGRELGPDHGTLALEDAGVDTSLGTDTAKTGSEAEARRRAGIPSHADPGDGGGVDLDSGDRDGLDVTVGQLDDGVFARYVRRTVQRSESRSHRLLHAAPWLRPKYWIRRLCTPLPCHSQWHPSHDIITGMCTFKLGFNLNLNCDESKVEGAVSKFKLDLRLSLLPVFAFIGGRPPGSQWAYHRHGGQAVAAPRAAGPKVQGQVPEVVRGGAHLVSGTDSASTQALFSAWPGRGRACLWGAATGTGSELEAHWQA